MNRQCCLIKDLLPLYVEEMTSPESAALIREHLASCPDCAAEARALQSGAPETVPSADEAAPLRRVKQDLKKRRRAAAVLAAALAFVAVCTVFSYLTRPNYVPFEDSGAKVAAVQNGPLSVSFSDKVTACRINTFSEPDDEGTRVIEIEAWSSAWDKILGKKTQTVVLTDRWEGAALRVVYCDCAKQGELMTLYGEPYDGGAVSLPRLVLGSYFLLAAGVAVAAGILRLALRRKEKAARITEYVLFAPVSYLAAHLILGAPFVTFAAAHEFVMLLIAAVGIYAALSAGVDLIRMRK